MSPALAGFEAGLFLPRDPPDWFGRSSYPPRVLLLKDGALHIVPHPATGEPPAQCPLERISAVESGHMLLKGWLRLVGPGFDHTLRYNRREYPPVFYFLRRLRTRLLPGAGPLAAPPVRLGGSLDIKFANALALELDPGETIAVQFFQPPRAAHSRGWWFPRRPSIAGDLLVLACARLLWITDRDRGLYARYGSIASYAPLSALRAMELTPAATGHALRIDLRGAPSWPVPVAAENLPDAEAFAAEFYRANLIKVSIRSGANLI